MSDTEFSVKVTEGIEFFNANNIPKTIVTLREAVAMDPGEEKDVKEKAHYYLAKAYYENGNFDESSDQLVHCGAYAPMKVFALIKDLAANAKVDFMLIVNELPQKSLYVAIIEEENKKRSEANRQAEIERQKQAEEMKLRLEVEGDYDNLFVDAMKAAPTNYIVPIFMGLISIPAWGAGMLLAFNLPKAVLRFVLEFVFYYLYVNQTSAQIWIANNFNLAKVFGYTETVHAVNAWVFPVCKMTYITLLFVFALQSFVVSFFEWYKIFMVANVVEIRNGTDIYINAGFDNHVNIGETFRVYTRGKKPVLKGVATILKMEDKISLVELRPDTNAKEIIQPKVGDYAYYKWI